MNVTIIKVLCALRVFVVKDYLSALLPALCTDQLNKSATP